MKRETGRNSFFFEEEYTFRLPFCCKELEFNRLSKRFLITVLCKELEFNRLSKRFLITVLCKELEFNRLKRFWRLLERSFFVHRSSVYFSSLLSSARPGGSLEMGSNSAPKSHTQQKQL